MSYPSNVLSDYLSNEIWEAFDRIDSERIKYIKDDGFEMFSEGYTLCYMKYQGIIRDLERKLLKEYDDEP
jgi:hypothetical protein